MKKLTIILTLVLVGTTAAFSQTQAVIKEVSGKVEVKASGEDWRPAREGAVISKGTVISTGFGAQAVLDLGTSTLRVRPLTRMRLDELIEKESTVSTELFLRVGKVRAEVKTAAGLKQDFTLRSPVSTAAVRGTSFEFDGLSVVVYENVVIFANRLNHRRTVQAGESSGTTGYRRPDRGEESRERKAEADPYTSEAAALLEGSESPTAPVTITWIW